MDLQVSISVCFPKKFTIEEGFLLTLMDGSIKYKYHRNQLKYGPAYHVHHIGMKKTQYVRKTEFYHTPIEGEMCFQVTRINSE